jgi:hypothetical protein
MASLFGAFVAGPAIVEGAPAQWSLPQIPSGCLFKFCTGIDCPACGVTRSVNALYHLNFEDSLHFHPAGFIVAAMAAGIFIYFLAPVCSMGKIGLSWKAEAKIIKVSSAILMTVLFGAWFTKLMY